MCFHNFPHGNFAFTIVKIYYQDFQNLLHEVDFIEIYV